MKPLTAAAITLVLILTVLGLVYRLLEKEGEPLTVVQWANGHLMRPLLLPQMAAEFNRANHRTESGKRIEIQLSQLDSVVQVDELQSRVLSGVPLNRRLENPTLLGTSADHWLVSGNFDAGRTIVDLDRSRSIARTWVGIVTYREMAECLGWPAREIGYADIIALANDDRGWDAYPCAKAEWGKKPRVAFTDPTTSSSGRSALYSLYAIAAGKPLEALTVQDIHDPKVVAYVHGFNLLLEHYFPGTLPLNTKVYQGPQYGHFFIIPEDNLVDLYRGTTAFVDGVQVRAPPITAPMVMIYPKEGSAVNNHSASIVEAPWITAELSEAAEQWIDFLLTERQQRRFMEDGFRPVSAIQLTEPISGKFGLDPAKPAVKLNPDRIDQEAAGAIVASWPEVKRPGIVTFVIDTSGSMQGAKLDQAKRGMILALDKMATNNQVGFLTFSSVVANRIDVGPLPVNRFSIASRVATLKAEGNTALYDAVKAGIEMSDSAPGDPDAIRAVVVLTDGLANAGRTGLDDLIVMSSRAEVAIHEYSGLPGATARDNDGLPVATNDLIGTGLALATQHNNVLVFFIGIGEADLNIGRVLAEATGAQYQGATDEDLGTVLETFSKYF